MMAINFKAIKSLSNSLTIPLALLISMLLFAFGAFFNDLFLHPPFETLKALFSFGCYSIFLYIFSYVLLKNRISVGLITAIGIFILSFMGGRVPELLLALFLFFSSAILGKKIIAFLSLKNSNKLLDLLVGLGILGTVTGLLAFFPVNYPILYIAILVIPIIANFKLSLRYFFEFCAFLKGLGSVKSSKNLFVFASLILVALIHFTFILFPTMDFDALAMHLFVGSYLKNIHFWAFDPSMYVFSLNPMLADWIFAVGYMLDGEFCTRIISLFFVYLTAYQIYYLIRSYGATSYAASVSSVLFLSTPLILLESSGLHIEVIWTSYLLSGVMLLYKLTITKTKPLDFDSDLSLISILMGMAMAIKMLTLAFLVIFIPCIFWALAQNRSFTYKRFFYPIGFFVLFASIPYLTAFLISGNPVFPLYNGIFKSPFYLQISQFDTRWPVGVNFNLIYDTLFHSGKFLESTIASPGFQWLFFLPVTILIIAFNRYSRPGFFLILGVLSFIIIFNSINYLRYVIPSLVFILVGMGIIFDAKGNLKKFLNLFAALAIILNLLFITSAIWGYRDFPLKIIFSNEEYSDFISQKSPIRDAINFINLVNQSKSNVAFLSDPFGFGLNANALYTMWYNRSFMEPIDRANTSDDILNTFKKFKCLYILLDDNWSSPEKRNMVKNVTYSLYKFKNVDVRVIDKKYLFKKELILNPYFNDFKGWQAAKNSNWDKQGKKILVSEPTPTYQIVSVGAGFEYKYEIVAKCDQEKTQGRLQVNWMNSAHQFIKADITLFDCDDIFTRHSILVRAPRNASAAAIYASSHSIIPMWVNEVSFKE